MKSYTKAGKSQIIKWNFLINFYDYNTLQVSQLLLRTAFGHLDNYMPKIISVLYNSHNNVPWELLFQL